jgi:hypothetical protein
MLGVLALPCAIGYRFLNPCGGTLVWHYGAEISIRTRVTSGRASQIG